MSKTSSKLVTFQFLIILQILLICGQTQNILTSTTPPYCLATDSKGNCISCISGFAIWGSTCVELASLNQFCLNFNGINCTTCKIGYVLMDGVCTHANPNCGSYDISGGCINCSQGYLNGPLCLIPSNCLNADQNGNCISCQNGFIIWGSNCVSLQSLYPFCSAFVNGLCTACNYGYFLNSGRCLFANPFCLALDQKGSCLSCSQGYILSGTFCVVSSPICNTTNEIMNICATCNTGFVIWGLSCVAQTTLNPFCLVFNGAKCLFCVTGYYLNNNRLCIYPTNRCLTSNSTTKKCLSCYPKYFLMSGQCLPVSPLCNGNNLDGSCKNCFTGYTLVGSICVSLISINPFCLAFRGPLCANCQNRYYLGNNTICTPVNLLCNKYSMSTGNCISCVVRYSISNGNCVSWSIINPQCVLFNNIYGNCINCADRYYLGLKTLCTPVNSLCKNYSMLRGICFTCITGYSISNGECLLWNVINPQCANFNNVTGGCLGCKNGYYLGPKTICLQVSSLCRTYSMLTGKCFTCITGFAMTIGNCVSWSSLNPQCNNFNAKGSCLNCMNGYYLGVNTICTKINSLCNIYQMANGKCISCIDGATLVGQDCFAIINNCDKYTSTGQCQKCGNSYTLVSQMCYSTVNYCYEYNTIGLCSQCESGYTIIGLNCVTIIPNCDSYSSNGQQCQLCLDRYILYNGYCYTSVSNCASFDSMTTLCNSCNLGNYLIQQNRLYSCILLPNYCLTVDYLGNCLSCIEGNIIYNNLCVPKDSISNCQDYNLPTFTCLACVGGYYLSSNNICSKLPPNCANADSDGKCQQCLNGNTLVSQSCFTTISNCSLYSSTGQCLTCNTGYTLVGQNCFVIISNCSSYSTNGKQCLQCLNGYTLYNNYCYTTISNCVTFNSTTYLCNGCTSGYYLVQQNRLYSCILLPNYCLTVDYLGNCITCTTGNIIYNYRCVPNNSISNCQNYNLPTFTCLSCVSSYYLSSNNICTLLPANCADATSSGICIKCVSNYTLVGQNCFATINNCDNYTLTGKCQTCNTAFTLVGQSCFATINNCASYNSLGKCQACNTAFTLVDQSCFATIINCANYTLTGQCTNCIANYSLLSQQCVSWISLNPQCNKFSSTGDCLNCTDRYYLGLNTQCTNVSSLCVNYDMNSGNCKSCIQGYIFLVNYCQSLSIYNPNCLTFNNTSCTNCSSRYYIGPSTICSKVSSTCDNYQMNTGNCVTCILGFSLSNNSCLSWATLDPQCLKFNNTNGFCLNCMVGNFILNTHKCSPFIQFCTSYNMNSGLCLSCNFSYVLTSNTCILASILNPNCIAFNNTICLFCKDRYYIAANGNCTAVSVFCTTYNNITGINGVCTGCLSTYVLINGTCVSNAVRFNNQQCANFNDTICISCNNPYYLGPNRTCILVNSLCKNYIMQTGGCTACFAGYATLNMTCIQTTSANPYCSAFVTTTCVNCTDRYYLGPRNVCIPVSQTCNLYEMTTGFCISCFFPWKLTAGNCDY